MIVYLVMLLLSAIFACFWQKCYVQGTSICVWSGSRKTICFKPSVLFGILSFLPFVLVNGTMSFVGNDYANYYREFLYIQSGQESYTDIGYVLLNKLVIALGLDFQFVYVFVSLIGYGLLFWCIRKYSANFAISIVLFFSIGYFYLLGLNQIRQFIALVIVFYALSLIPNGKFLTYAALVGVASLFHFTAIIMLPFFFILKIKPKLSYFLVAMIVLLPFNLFYTEIMQFLFSTFRPAYVGSSYMERQISIDILSLIPQAVVLFILLFYFDKIIKTDAMNLIAFNGILIAIIIMSVCSWIPEYKRFIYYFYLPMIYVIPNILQLEKRKSVRYLLLDAVIVCSLVPMLRSASGWGVYPYSSVLF